MIDPYVVPERLFTMSLNALFIAFASVPMAATAANAISTISNAYSVKSCPCSSCHSSRRKRFIAASLPNPEQPRARALLRIVTQYAVYAFCKKVTIGASGQACQLQLLPRAPAALGLSGLSFPHCVCYVINSAVQNTVIESVERGTDAIPVRQTEESPSSYCPVCSARLEPHRCKLCCRVCGYYMSCSDYY
jgi:hypothetical protein